MSFLKDTRLYLLPHVVTSIIKPDAVDMKMVSHYDIHPSQSYPREVPGLPGGELEANSGVPVYAVLLMAVQRRQKS